MPRLCLALPVVALLSGCATTAEISHRDGSATRIKKGVFDEMTIPTDPPIKIGPSPVAKDGAVAVVQSAGDNIVKYAIDRAAQTETAAAAGER